MGIVSVSVSASGFVQAKKPGKATIKVLSIFYSFNYDEVQGTVYVLLRPHSNKCPLTFLLFALWNLLKFCTLHWREESISADLVKISRVSVCPEKSAMDLVSGYKGVAGLVFGNEKSGSSNEDSYVERLLDCISNGKLSEDRRTAMLELQSVVAESSNAQLAFGAMGFPVMMGILKEERDDVEMVRGALETLVSALTPIDHAKGPKNEIQPALMNADLLSREADNISLLLSLLSEEDFYVRYYTLQLLTALLTNSPNRLQEAILTIPRGITRLMDMLMDREVIRNEALLLLTYLTREAEIVMISGNSKIVVFEGAFEKIFSIIKEEGGSDGGVVVQDCIELLNNLIRKNASNQVLLRETVGFDPFMSILKLRGSTYSFTQQKKKVLDHLLMLGAESQWAPVAVRCAVR
ncbi:golgin candidate 6-like isoform X2 [Prunus yedoensis var. nudiflora]|uniref:Golgin candidate 6-like isoform X2 n=1 Tax=Prunus yedoensis var. nudiflora TaxID=2094558 RepID=A0A314Z3D2_PRUYE|nr:golgin candidate 6-like isoform X2 [Prunus yedoensis var. nudiflora]